MLFANKRETVGIDIGSSSVKLVQLREQKGVFHLVNVGILPLPAEAIVDNTLMDSSSIVETIKNILGSLAIKASDAACSISGNAVIIRKIALPAMTSEELEEQIQWEAEQYIPFDINDVNIDFQILAQDESRAGIEARRRFLSAQMETDGARALVSHAKGILHHQRVDETALQILEQGLMDAQSSYSSMLILRFHAGGRGSKLYYYNLGHVTHDEAKDRAAEAVSRVMIPEALDYPQ